ncbi:hypothetical protein W911_13845 [Hyphomicrobium nitrativorans NL23]|uniref:VWFA domain-containing protein n=1 Tax=Hyphomicrobium nitrativorans NL23 TaxID=1029756 RepID=V5SED1_9HYPH|nr:VWA domain-containing protein [Hyphomicrobium nitrativorans]AHB49251.1 hypothetical protein W911_13845 [Hyphomicrobium nitrativorans NL23]
MSLERSATQRAGHLTVSMQVLLASALLLLVGGGRAVLAAGPACMSDAMIVFDASGSMAALDFPDGGPSRFDRAKASLGTFLPTVSPQRRLGLVTYGPGASRNACANASLRVRPQPNFAEPILSEVEALRPAGRTPLTLGVRMALDALPETAATVVLLTDGQETCHGDPCALARQLRSVRPSVTVHVIGYKLQMRDGRAESGAECLASETGGLNVTADTVDELNRAFEQTLGCTNVAQLTRRQEPATLP